MQQDWRALRAEFPVLEQWTYLNSATFGPVPRAAVEAMERHLAHRDAQACLDFIEWYDEADRVRAKAARLIGAQAEDIAFIPNAGTALSWVLEGLDWKPGDRIVGLEDDFPNNIYAPLRLAERGVEFQGVSVTPDFEPEDLLGAIDERTRLALVSALNYSSGLKPPLEALGRKTAAAGALFVIDGTQGVGAIPFGVEQTRADVVIVHAYKWMLCPPGVGFMYIRPEARERLRPTVVSWRSHRGWRQVSRLHHGAPELPAEAARYEGGMLNFTGILALESALDLMAGVGHEALFDRVAWLAESTRAVLREAGGRPLGDQNSWFRSPIVTARFPELDLAAVGEELRRRRIAVAARHGSLRVSPHVFNDEGDLEALSAALARLGAEAAASSSKFD